MRVRTSSTAQLHHLRLRDYCRSETERVSEPEAQKVCCQIPCPRNVGEATPMKSHAVATGTGPKQGQHHRHINLDGGKRMEPLPQTRNQGGKAPGSIWREERKEGIQVIIILKIKDNIFQKTMSSLLTAWETDQFQRSSKAIKMNSRVVRSYVVLQ